MVNVTINGIDIDFPFEPYQCQIQYMQKVIECLQKGKNGVLESPTGTGKTLCLLCATLAWREAYVARLQLEQVGKIESDFKDQLGSHLSEVSGDLNEGGSWERGFKDIPKIVYASRTHSQLSQAVNELKNTRYVPKVCVLGSREQMCINSEVMKEESNNGKVHLCRSKVAGKNCFYYNNLEASKGTVPSVILDIEDLVSIGTEKKFCPYYMARELRKEADLIFMPYNYVLDFKARSAHGIDLNNTVILLDEAHNVESVCESNASFDLTSFDIASCIEDSQQCIEILMEKEEEGFTEEVAPGDLDKEDAALMKTLFLKLEALVCEVTLNKNDCATKSASFLFNEMSKLNIHTQSRDQIIETLEKMSGMLAGTTKKVFKGKTYALDKFASALKVMFARSGNSTDNVASNDATTQKFYKVHIHAEKSQSKKAGNLDAWTSNSSSSSKAGRTLSYWCFNPGLTMKELCDQGIRSLILTSGTLSPLASFKQELHIPFDVELENMHVIEPYQVFVGVIPQGPDGKKLNSSYKFRSTPEYQISLGNTVVNLSRIIPNGLLVFFPSYPVMDMVIAKWQECGIWNRLSVNKGLFIEPRKKAGLADAMEEYYEKINDPALKGAIFFAVCRGKVSEGLDFADANGRGVIITGLPFPPSFDPRVVLKMEYLEENKNKDRLPSKLWYRQQASRAVNQAIGRVIRHKNDFGAIILCDERFSYSDAKAHLPVWLKNQVKSYKDFGQAQRDLVGFFRDIQQKMGVILPIATTKRKFNEDIAPYTSVQNKSLKKMSSTNIDFDINCYKNTNNNKNTNTNTNASMSLSMIDSVAEKKSSFFDSITPNVQCCSKDVQSSKIPSCNNSLTNKAADNDTGVKIHPKVKKYKLIKNIGSTNENKATASSCSSSKQKQADNFQQNAKRYLSKVKSVLNKNQYDQFGSAMRLYKQSSNVNVLVAQFEKIFERSNLEHIELLDGFGLFIKKEKDKKHFEKAFESFTGT